LCIVIFVLWNTWIIPIEVVTETGQVVDKINTGAFFSEVFGRFRVILRSEGFGAQQPRALIPENPYPYAGKP
jgi:hypothetical protein